MLASHNTMTYLQPCNRLHRLTAWLWRCQTRRPDNTRAEALDLRVRRHHGRWHFAHGRVRLGEGRNTLRVLLTLHGVPKKPCRLILEGGCDLDRQFFADEARALRREGWPVFLAAYKDGWQVVFRDPTEDDKCRDHYYKPTDSAKPWWRNVWHALTHPSTIARYAAQHPPLASEAADDLYHFHDHL